MAKIYPVRLEKSISSGESFSNPVLMVSGYSFCVSSGFPFPGVPVPEGWLQENKSRMNERAISGMEKIFLLIFIKGLLFFIFDTELYRM